MIISIPNTPPRTSDGGQPNNDDFNLKTQPILSNRSANECDHDNGISNGKSTLTTKRQRCASPHSTLSYASTPPLPYSEDAKSSLENIDYSNLDE
jgi:hypothetical protein